MKIIIAAALTFILLATQAQATNLSVAAAALSPGSWVSFPTSNFTNGAVLRPSGGGSALEYQEHGWWNPIDNSVMILGGAHGAPNVDSMQFAKLTDSNNTWSTLTEPIPTFDTSFGGFGAHTYDHDTINPTTGDFYHRQYGTGRFMKFSHAAQTWSMCRENTNLNVGGTNVAGSLMYFPERNSLVYLDGAWGLWELSLAAGDCTTATWVERAATVVANPPLQQLTGLFDYHNEGIYSALCSCLIFGGGNGSKVLYKMNAAGTITTVAAAPAAITQFKIPDASGGTIMTVDPVSGNILVWKDTTAATTMYVLNPSTEAWSTITRTALAFPSVDAGVNETVAIPISTYGVIMFVQVGSSATGNVWLYKHAAGAADGQAPTDPTSLVATATGSSTIQLTWTASTDNVGVAGYNVERCSSAACVNFLEVGLPGGSPFNDSGLTASTLYRYRVRAHDAANNFSGYSSISQATTQAAGGGSDFTSRCAAPGVVRCFSFDDAAAIGNAQWGADFGYFHNLSTDGGCAGLVNDTCPVLDNSVFSSGGGSIKFTIKNGSGQATGGQWYGNFSTDLSRKFGAGETIYVQWRARFDSGMAFNFQDSGGQDVQWKHTMLNAGDNAGCAVGNTTNCTQSGGANEMVTHTKQKFFFPVIYNSQGDTGPHTTPFADFEEPFGPSDFKMQNARVSPYCLYSQKFTVPVTLFPPSGNCVPFVTDEWMTFKIKITMGPLVGVEYDNTSNVKLWVARDGQPSELVIDWTNWLVAGSVANLQKYGKIWLLTHMTGKNSAQVHPDAHVWYDDLIISTQDIADPGATSPSSSPKSVVKRRIF